MLHASLPHRRHHAPGPEGADACAIAAAAGAHPPSPSHSYTVLLQLRQWPLYNRCSTQVSDSAIGDTDVVTSLRSPQNKL